MTEIIIVGFPKSGNTWLSRLLSDALDWPVRGIGTARPLAECGEVRGDGCLIRQLHLYPEAHGNEHPAIASQFTLNTDRINNGHKIIHIMRDPRDVAVAINHYWGVRDLRKVITQIMVSGDHPLWGCGWVQYVEAWKRATVPVLETRFEWLHEDTQLELARILDALELRAVKPLGEVVTNNTIDTKRDQIRNDPDERYTHGKGAQLANLRGGRIGDWRAEFDEVDAIEFYNRFNDKLFEYGFEDDPEWHWLKVQTC